MAYGISSEQMIEALEDSGGLISLAAKKLGCAPNTIRNRATKVQSVRQVIIDARAKIVDQAELSLQKAVLNGEPWAVQLVLRTLGRDRGYSEKSEVEVSGPGGKPLELAVVERIVDVTDRDKLIEGTARLLPE